MPSGEIKSSNLAKESTTPRGRGTKTRYQISPLKEDNDETKMQIHSVDYLSPHELRSRLEIILRMHGRQGLSKNSIQLHHPTLFYNLVWYCTRLKIAFPLFSNKDDEDEDEGEGEGEEDHGSFFMDEVEEQVLLGPHERWARETIEARRTFVAEHGRHVFHVAKGAKDGKSVKGALLSSDILTPCAAPAAPPRSSSLGQNRKNRMPSSAAPTTDPTTPIPAPPMTPTTAPPKEKSTSRRYYEQLQKFVKRGDIDKALTKSIRSQHLFMPEMHSYTVYSILRACANDCPNSAVLLGSNVRMPGSIFEFKMSMFDQMYHRSVQHLTAQLRSDMTEGVDLSTSGGYLLTDRRALVFRHVFGDIFHGMQVEEDCDSSSDSEELMEELMDRKRVKRAALNKQMSLEEHLIRERLANFTPPPQNTVELVVE